MVFSVALQDQANADSGAKECVEQQQSGVRGGIREPGARNVHPQPGAHSQCQLSRCAYRTPADDICPVLLPLLEPESEKRRTLQKTVIHLIY